MLDEIRINVSKLNQNNDEIKSLIQENMAIYDDLKVQAKELNEVLDQINMGMWNFESIAEDMGAFYDDSQMDEDEKEDDFDLPHLKPYDDEDEDDDEDECEDEDDEDDEYPED